MRPATNPTLWALLLLPLASFSFLPPLPGLAGHGSNLGRLQTRHTSLHSCPGILERETRWRGSGVRCAMLSSNPALKSVLLAPASIVGALVVASVVHALQGGVRGYRGATQDNILGVPAEEATVEDIKRLDKAGFMQLFYASPCPEMGDLDGEYLAQTLPMGVLHPVASVITNRVWGPGLWKGKAVRLGNPEGYNIFERRRKGLPSSAGEAVGDRDGTGTVRARRFRVTERGRGVFDEGESTRFDYGREMGNGLIFGGMRDEVRTTLVDWLRFLPTVAWNYLGCVRACGLVAVIPLILDPSIVLPPNLFEPRGYISRVTHARSKA
ncbi:unnamed protein product [Discosporangium mesarthrocarpum]